MPMAMPRIMATTKMAVRIGVPIRPLAPAHEVPSSESSTPPKFLPIEPATPEPSVTQLTTQSIRRGDPVTARGGVGKFCRDREAEVVERRQILDTAMVSVGQTADPQTDAAIKLVAWMSHGMLRPAPEDFAMHV